MLEHFQVSISFVVERKPAPNDGWYLVTPILHYLDDGKEEQVSSMLCQEEEVERVKQAFREVVELAVRKVKGEQSVMNTIAERLEYLREQLRNESISYGELAELESLAAYIDPDDTELLQAINPWTPEASL